jgi:hypothetical protein
VEWLQARALLTANGVSRCPRGQGISLGEILLLRRHTDAGIRNGKFDPFASVRHLANPQGNLALFRELVGIAQQNCC